MKSIKINPGDWVLLKDDIPVAADPDLKKIVEEYRKYPADEVIISKEPVSAYCYY